MALKGVKFTEEHKRHTKENHSHYWKGKSAHNKGIQMSEDQKQKIRITRSAQRELFIGEGGPAWKGGNIGYWQKEAKIRDHFTCRICGLYDQK